MVEAPHWATAPSCLVWRSLVLLLAAAADSLGRPTDGAETVLPATMLFSSLYLFMRYGPEAPRSGKTDEQTSDQPEEVTGNLKEGTDPQSLPHDPV